MAISLSVVVFATVFIFHYIPIVEAGGTVGDSCHYNDDCTAYRSYCRVISPSCGGGTCTCVPGFVVGTDGSCKRKVSLGGSCSLVGDLCEADNSACLGNTCQCSQGYSTGLKGTDCVSWQKSVRYGGACTDSTNCYYGMVCTNSVCSCSTGQKAISDYDCTPRTISDACSTNDDCSLTPNAVCSNGRCACQGGYRVVTYMPSHSAPTKFSYACIPNIESLKVEGSQCSTTIGASGTQVCMKPFICTQCDNSGYKFCGRVVPTLLSLLSKSNMVGASVNLMAIASIVTVIFKNVLI